MVDSRNRAIVFKIEEMLGDLDLLLNHSEFYSRKLDTILKELNVSEKYLENCIIPLYEQEYEKINIFIFEGEKYIGTVSQEERYKKDKESGINPFENKE